MSLVCFPFKEEDVAVAVRNVQTAAEHPRVSCVLCVGYSRGETWHAIELAAPSIEKATNAKVVLLQQKRIGLNLRPGKGDGMNTALLYFLENVEYSRLHFYDIDIVSFTEEWITKAEKQADMDYDVVRHYFPRSSTDAMITWLVTKIGVALIWPYSVLPQIEQPLGGELLLTRKAAEVLMADQRVRAQSEKVVEEYKIDSLLPLLLQSDWGIDTLYTFVTAQAGLRVAEVYIAAGKVHALYGGLRDLRTMLVECFTAIQTLRNEKLDDILGVHHVEFAKPVPENIKQKVGYDIEKTLKLLRDNWTPRQKELLQQHFDPALVKSRLLLKNHLSPHFPWQGLLHASEWPCWSFCDEDAWVAAYPRFLDHFEKGDEDWEELLFKVWVARVINHTLKNVIRGYDVALGTLRDLVRGTQHRSAMQLRASAAAAAAAAAHPIATGHSAMEGLATAGSKASRKKSKWSLDNADANMCTVLM
eukprot:SM000019S04991  [mRNA]  locus=s19:362703:366286:- [translate_table: standard]